MKELEAIKRKDRTQDDIINYLLASKREMQLESQEFAKTEEFEKIRKKLKALKNKQ